MADEITPATTTPVTTPAVETPTTTPVDPFLPEGSSVAPGDSIPGTPASDQQIPQNPANPDATQDPKPGEPRVDAEGNPIVETETPTVVPPVTTEAPKLLAGKFADMTALKGAYANLGGDPNKYEKPEQLEEAYLIRQAEYTRVKQEQAEQARLNETPPTPPVTPEQAMEKIKNSIDYTKMDNAQQLVEQLVPAIINNIAPLLQAHKELSPDEIAQTVAPMIAKREAATKEISEVENDVPRLKLIKDASGVAQPNPFRDAFAAYVTSQKQNGTYSGLKESMKSFVSINDGVVADKVNQQTTTTQIKNSAGQPPEGGEGTPAVKNPETDILTGIVEAYKERKGKFGF